VIFAICFLPIGFGVFAQIRNRFAGLYFIKQYLFLDFCSLFVRS
jgi:hypothetical protein